MSTETKAATSDLRKLVFYTVNDVYTTVHMAKLKQFIIDKNKELKPTKHLVVLPGDFLGPSTLGLFDNGKNMVEVMNAVGFDYVCYGNHEFDYKIPVLEQRLLELDSTILNSNARFATQKSVAASEDIPHNKKRRTLDVPNDVIELDGGFKVGLVGLLCKETQDMLEIINGSSPVKVTHVLDSCQNAVDQVRQQEPGLNMVVALTHQYVNEDRLVAKTAKNLDLILGGHEHDVYNEVVNGVPLLKVGADTENVGIVHVDIKADNSFTITIEVVPIKDYPREDEAVKKLIVKGNKMLENYSSHVLYKAPRDKQPLSSENVRNQQTSLGTLFCDLVRDFFRTQVCLIQSGKLRAQKNYSTGTLNFLDIQSELPFPNNQAYFCKLSGKEIIEAVKHSRTHSKGQGGFLQVDSQTIVDDSTHEVTHIMGKPLETDRLYTVALPLVMLKGLDNNPSLTAAGLRMNAEKIPQHDLLQLQEVVTKELVQRFWQALPTPKFDSVDANSDDLVDKDEFRQAMDGLLPSTMIDLFFDSLDNDGDGLLTADEFEIRFENFRTMSESKSGDQPPKRPRPGSKSPLLLRRETLSLWKQRGESMSPRSRSKINPLLPSTPLSPHHLSPPTDVSPHHLAPPTE
eukprot:g39502.t1